MVKMIHFVMSDYFLEDNLIMTDSCANATNSNAKVTNSIAKTCIIFKMHTIMLYYTKISLFYPMPVLPFLVSKLVIFNKLKHKALL